MLGITLSTILITYVLLRFQHLCIGIDIHMPIKWGIITLTKPTCVHWHRRELCWVEMSPIYNEGDNVIDVGVHLCHIHWLWEYCMWASVICPNCLLVFVCGCGFIGPLRDAQCFNVMYLLSSKCSPGESTWQCCIQAPCRSSGLLLSRWVSMMHQCTVVVHHEDECKLKATCPLWRVR